MSDEMKKYLGILMEDALEKFKALGEGQADILRTVEESKEKLTIVESEIKYTNLRLGNIEKNVVTIKKDIKEIKNEIKEQDHQIKDLSKRVIGLELA